ncbi:MAG: hypothetical protein ACYC8T_31325, partial [Myxococcaceae bacterium]
SSPVALCGPEFCGGCCLEGVCQPGTDESACGGGGQACAVCPSGERCLEALCKAAGGEPDAGSSLGWDGGSKAALCASTFGSALTAAFGRLDGRILAVVGPTDTQCTLPNSDHLVVQVLMQGAVYRVVVSILSDGRNGTDTRLRYAEVHRPLSGGPWAEGWHPGASLDYPGTLGMHSDGGFTAVAMTELAAKVTDKLVIGARLSAFSTSAGGTRASSSHLVHRNYPPPDSDGALVVDPDSADPLHLLFFYDGASF